ncbi:MAG TPA: amidohydrolase family protein [Vicinamibacterales bacterium]
MKTFAATLAAAGLLAMPPAQPPAITAFTNVSVVPMDRAAVMSGMTVLVQGGRITAVTAGLKPPAQSTVIDGTGKFLMPALAEMHAHVPGGNAPDEAVERVLMLYAANGLGTIRGMLGHPRHLDLRERLKTGAILGPELVTSGPSFNGQSAPTPDAAIEMVRAQKRAGYDFLKIHPGLSRATFDALVGAAAESGITFSGHVPADVGLARALEAGYRTIDHLDGFVEALATSQAPSDFFGVNLAKSADESKLADLVARTKAAGTWMVPTQNLMENVVGEITAGALKARPEMRYESTPAPVIEKWVELKRQLSEKYSAEERRHFLALRRRIILALHKAGVPFLLGVDAPQMWNVPGFSTHRELQSLVAAGLTPYQALQTGTVNVARFLGREASAGTIAAGKAADLLLVDANPLADISNTTRITGVMIDGRYFTQEELLK